MAEIKATVYLVPYMVRNKPENERGHTILAKARGWVKEALNRDGDELVSENVGLDALMTKCNLKPDGVTKIDPDKPIGLPIEVEGEVPEAVLVESITFIPPDTNPKVGDKFFCDYTLLPANATIQEVNWISSDEAVIKTLADGQFEAIKAGSATIKAVAMDGSEVFGEGLVTVEPVVVPVTSVTISPKTKTIKVGETFKLTSTVMPTLATNKTVQYTSADPTTATVDQSGNVNGIKVGVVKITATCDGKTDVCDVTVEAAVVAVTSVTITPKTKTMKVGDTAKLVVAVLPADATDKTFTITCDNEAVLKLTNQEGDVEALTEGKAKVTVTTKDGSFTAVCDVTVNPAGEA